MYKNYNMTQLTLPIETSVRIPQNDISRYVNEIFETIPSKNDVKNHLICIYSICIFWS